MKKTSRSRKTKAKKLGVILPMVKSNEPTDDADELDAIRAYDSAKASGETARPYEEVLTKISGSRR